MPLQSTPYFLSFDTLASGAFNPGPYIYKIKTTAPVTLDGVPYITDQEMPLNRKLITRQFADDIIANAANVLLYIYPEADAKIPITSADPFYVKYVQDTYNNRNKIWKDLIDLVKVDEAMTQDLIDATIGVTVAPLINGLIPEINLPVAFSGDMSRPIYAANGVTGVVDHIYELVDQITSNPAYTNLSIKDALDSKEPTINLTEGLVVVSQVGNDDPDNFTSDITVSTITVGEVNTLDGATSNIQDQIDGLINLTEKAVPGGVATLDSNKRLPTEQLPWEALEYKGAWDAATNSPTLVDGTGNLNDIHVVSVAGTVDFGSTPITFYIGDWVFYNNDDKWEKLSNSTVVSSVNGETGVVVLDAEDFNETASRIWFTQAEKDKLATLETGAEVNVQRDYDATSGDAYILNKPFGGLNKADFENKITNELEPLLVLDPNMLVVSDINGKLDTAVASNELLFLTGINDYVQDQLDGKQDQLVLGAGYAVVSNAMGQLVGSVVTTSELAQLSGITGTITVQDQLDLLAESDLLGAANGIAELDGSARLPLEQFPLVALVHQGPWNAATNTPTLSDSDTNVKGYVYVASNSATVNLGSGAFDVRMGDWVINNGTIWEHSDNSNLIKMVNTYSAGNIVLDAEDIAETASRIWFTQDEKDLLASVEAGAEVNVQKDWGATGGDALILNKPVFAVAKNTYFFGRPAALFAYDEIWSGCTGDGGAVNGGTRIMVSGTIVAVSFKTDNCANSARLRLYINQTGTIASGTTYAAESTEATAASGTGDQALIFTFGAGLAVTEGQVLRMALTGWNNYPACTVIVQEA